MLYIYIYIYVTMLQCQLIAIPPTFCFKDWSTLSCAPRIDTPPPINVYSVYLK